MANAVDEHLIIFEPDHDARARELLLWQHHGKPRIEAFISAVAAGAQLLESTAWAVIVGGSFTAAEGVTLDRWGEMLGEVRGDLDNELYRRFIELRIRVNTEHPSEDALYEVLAAAVAPSTVKAFPLPPGGLKFIVYSDEFVSDSIRAHTAALIRDFRPAGVIVAVIETVPDRMMLDWEEDAPPIGSAASPGTGVISRLIYSGRGRA